MTIKFIIEVISDEVPPIPDGDVIPPNIQENESPIFNPLLGNTIEVVMGQTFEYTVSAEDPDGDYITLSCKLQTATPFVTLINKETPEVILVIAPTVETASIQEYEVSFIIDEVIQETGETNRITETLTISVIEEAEEEDEGSKDGASTSEGATDISDYYIGEEDVKDEDIYVKKDEEEKLEPITAEVIEVNAAGQVIIEYSEPVNAISNYRDRLEEEDQEIVKATLNINQDTNEDLYTGFGYNVTVSNSTQVHIDFTFGKPLEISKGPVADSITIQL